VPEGEKIESKIISRLVEASQARVEGMNFDLRKHILDYDDVMNKHREVIYRKRREILEKSQIPNPNDQSNPKSQIPNNQNNLRDYILEVIKKQGFSEDDYVKKEKEIGEENMRQFEKLISLRMIDSFWIDHLYAMEHLRDSVRLRGYGQQDPLIEYKRESHKLFQQLLAAIELNIAKTLMAITIRKGQAPEPQARMADNPASSLQSVKSGHRPKISRNEPCPCGKKNPVTAKPIKYKKCCYPKFG
jgi:preprotein translocase subunit SecA